MRKVFAAAAAVAALSVAGTGTAFAGEVTGKGKPTPVQSGVAASICAFSGLEDGESLWGPVQGGPGVTQTPHGEPAVPILYPPGIPGQACRGNSGGEG